jgi:hypothetical protein
MRQLRRGWLVWAVLAVYTPGLSTAQEDKFHSIERELQPDRPFTLASRIDVGDQLLKGPWIVLLARPTDEQSQEAIRQFQRMATDCRRLGLDRQIAIINVRGDPSAENGQGGDIPWLAGRVIDERPWQDRMPIVLVLNEGNLVRAELPGFGNTRFAVSQESQPAARSPSALGIDLEEMAERGSSFPDASAARRERREHSLSSGRLALVEAARAVGVQLPLDAFDDRLAASGVEGDDLETLSRLCSAVGLTGLMVSASPEELARAALPAVIDFRYSPLQGPALASDCGAAVAWTDQSVTIRFAFAQDLLVPFYRLPGMVRALVVSREPTSVSRLGLYRPEDDPELSALQADPPIVWLGAMRRLGWKREVTVTNPASRPVVVTEIRGAQVHEPAAGCTIPAGGAVQFSFGGTGPTHGRYSSRLVLATDEPGRLPLIIPVVGWMESPAYLPLSSLVIEHATPGLEQTRTLPLHLAEGIEAGDLKVLVEGHPSWTAAIRHEGGQAVLDVTWKGASETGWHKAAARIYQDDPKLGATAQLHLAVRVAQPASAIPFLVRIGNEELAGTWTRRIRLDCHPSLVGPWEATWSDPQSVAGVGVSLAGSETGGSPTELIVSAPAGAVEPLTSAALLLQSGGQPMASIAFRFGAAPAADRNDLILTLRHFESIADRMSCEVEYYRPPSDPVAMEELYSGTTEDLFMVEHWLRDGDSFRMLRTRGGRLAGDTLLLSHDGAITRRLFRNGGKLVQSSFSTQISERAELLPPQDPLFLLFGIGSRRASDILESSDEVAVEPVAETPGWIRATLRDPEWPRRSMVLVFDDQRRLAEFHDVTPNTFPFRRDMLKREYSEYRALATPSGETFWFPHRILHRHFNLTNEGELLEEALTELFVFHRVDLNPAVSAKAFQIGYAPGVNVDDQLNFLGPMGHVTLDPPPVRFARRVRDDAASRIPWYWIGVAALVLIGSAAMGLDRLRRRRRDFLHALPHADDEAEEIHGGP